MPTRPSNFNVFIFQRSLVLFFATTLRPWDFAVSPKSWCSLPLSSEVSQEPRSNPVLAVITEVSKERPEHSHHRAHRQHRDKDELPPARPRSNGKVGRCICAPAKHPAETVGMVIKNQNAHYLLARGISSRQTTRVLDHENPSPTDGGPAAVGRKAKKPGITGWHQVPPCDAPSGPRHVSAPRLR